MRSLGVLAWRIPASGMYESRRKMSLPDVIAFCKGEFLGFQVKASSKRYVRVYRRQLEPLDVWLSDVLEHGVPARAFVAVKFVGGWWKIQEFDGLRHYDFDIKGATRLRGQLELVLGLQTRLEVR